MISTETSLALQAELGNRGEKPFILPMMKLSFSSQKSKEILNLIFMIKKFAAVHLILNGSALFQLRNDTGNK
jgi:hypothetical protein